MGPTTPAVVGWGYARPGGTDVASALRRTTRLSAYAVKAVKKGKKVHFAEAGALPQLFGVSGSMDLPTDEPHPAKHHSLDRKIELGNRYGALYQEDEVEDSRFVIQLQDAVKMPSLNRLRKERRMKLCQEFQQDNCCSTSGCPDGCLKKEMMQEMTGED